MDKNKRLELLLKARNILHKQESGEKLSNNDIVIAHDYVDMIIDDMIEEFTKKYVILISRRDDNYDRHWVTRPTLEEAEKVSFQYEKDNQFNTEIYEIGNML